MNNYVRLYTYGRQTMKGAWTINRSRIVNRLYYVNSGSAFISNGTQKFELRPGSIYIFPQCSNFDPIDAFAFDHTFFDFYSSHILRYDSFTEINTSSLSIDGFFSYINSVIASDKERACLNALENLLVGLLSTIDSLHFPLPYVSNTAVACAVEEIHKNYADITTASLAHKLNLNESYFIRLFGAAMGTSPSKYIRDCRVLYGKELLLGGNSVAEVAEACGYNSATAFYKAVKSAFGVSPSELKKIP